MSYSHCCVCLVAVLTSRTRRPKRLHLALVPKVLLRKYQVIRVLWHLLASGALRNRSGTSSRPGQPARAWPRKLAPNMSNARTPQCHPRSSLRYSIHSLFLSSRLVLVSIGSTLASGLSAGLSAAGVNSMNAGKILSISCRFACFSSPKRPKTDSDFLNRQNGQIRQFVVAQRSG